MNEDEEFKIRDLNRYILYPIISVIIVISFNIYCEFRNEIRDSRQFVGECKISCLNQGRSMKECNWSRRTCECGSKLYSSEERYE